MTSGCARRFLARDQRIAQLVLPDLPLEDGPADGQVTGAGHWTTHYHGGVMVVGVYAVPLCTRLGEIVRLYRAGQ